jgi:3-oxoacyl-[acyl-carrier-protein] synthase-3
MRLAAIAAHIPAGRIDADDIVRAAGRPLSEARVFKHLFGIEQVSASSAPRPLAAEFEPILDRLLDDHTGPRPDAMIYVHGLPLQYPRGHSPLTVLGSHPMLAGVKFKYEVDQHNCSGMFWALEMARHLLHGGIAHSVLIIAGDSHANVPLADRYVPGCTLMGEAYCGLVVDQECGGWRFEPMVLHMKPEFHFGRAGTAQQMSAFFSGHSKMVKSALDESGFDWLGAAPLLPHNVNRLAWQQLCREHGLDYGRVDLSLLPDVGHCYTSDPFLLLCELLGSPEVEADAATLISVGMGGFVGACTIHKQMSFSNGASR